MDLHPQRDGEILIIEPKEKNFDVASSMDFIPHVQKTMEQEGGEHLIIDLNHVEFMDSTGLGQIVSLRKKTDERIAIVLCNLQERVRTVFRLTRLDRYLSIVDTRKDALLKLHSEISI